MSAATLAYDLTKYDINLVPLGKAGLDQGLPLFPIFFTFFN